MWMEWWTRYSDLVEADLSLGWKWSDLFTTFREGWRCAHDTLTWCLRRQLSLEDHLGRPHPENDLPINDNLNESAFCSIKTRL